MTEGTRISVTVVRGKKSTDYEFEWRSFGTGGKWWHYDPKKKDWVSSPDRLHKKATARALELSEIGAEPSPTPMPVQLKMDFSRSLDEPMHDDITPETIIEPVMYRADILGPKPKHRTLQRHHVGDGRYYVIQFEQPDGTWSRPELYPGVTSICKAVLPRSRHIEEWMCGFVDYEAAMQKLHELSVRGTVMHTLFAFCLDPLYEMPDFGTSEFDRMVRGLIAKHENIDVDRVFHEWKNFFCKSILGFKQFMYDYDVEVLAIEIVLGQPTIRREDGSKPLYGYFAQVDLICIMDWEFEGDFGEKYKSGKNLGKPKITKQTRRVVGVGDFKSGQSDSPPHDLQLDLIEPLVTRAFPDLEPKEIILFNWHPTEFRSSSIVKKIGGEETETTEESDGKPAKGVEFPYRVIDKTLKATKRQKSWSKDLLHFWQKHIAGELPKKLIYKGSPKIDTRPADNVEVKDYATYWEEKIVKARGRGLLDGI